MAARGNLVINDRATTPVAHTFSPDGTDANGVALFSEKGSVPAGNPRYSARIRQTKDRYRAEIRLAVPVVQTQTINGVSSPVLVRTAYVELNTSFDKLSSTQERNDAIGFMVNSLATSQTQIHDLVVGLTDIW